MVTFDLATIPRVSRREAWSRAAARLIHPMAVAAAAEDDLAGCLDVQDAQDLRLIRVAGPPSRIARSPQLIRAADPGVVQPT